jgi:hypothetical protein
MPHRLDAFTLTLSQICELALLGVLAVWQGGAALGTAIAKEDWKEITGPNGVAYISVLACIVLWWTFVSNQKQTRKDNLEREIKEDARIKAEDEAKERRHTEQLAASKAAADDVKALTVEAIKAQLIAAAEIKTHAANTQMLSMNVHELLQVVKKSPCLATHQLRDAPPQPDSRL